MFSIKPIEVGAKYYAIRYNYVYIFKLSDFRRIKAQLGLLRAIFVVFFLSIII